MKTMTVAEFKTHFSAALDAVRAGETIVVAYGQNRKKVAAMVPYESIKQAKLRPLGLLKDRACVRFAKDFSVSDEEFLAL
jgi:antitoxin (DNA-binding transcriptional repressor) of toxin-antitoxin stability system